MRLLLLENIKQSGIDLQERYGKLLAEKNLTLQDIFKIDPSDNKIYSEKIIYWLLYNKGVNLNLIKDTIELFHINKNNPNLKGIDLSNKKENNNFWDFRTRLLVETGKKVSPTDFVKYGEIQFRESPIVAETNNYLYVNLMSKHASIYYCQNERQWYKKTYGSEVGAWCIGIPQSSANLFYNYKKDYNLVLFIQDKNDIEETDIVIVNIDDRNLETARHINRSNKENTLRDAAKDKKKEYISAIKKILEMISATNVNNVREKIENEEWEDVLLFLETQSRSIPDDVLTDLLFYLCKKEKNSNPNVIKVIQSILNKMFLRFSTENLEIIFSQIITNNVKEQIKCINNLLFFIPSERCEIGASPLDNYKLLFKYNLNYDIFNEMKETPLYAAIFTDCLEAVSLLLKHGANPNLIVKDRYLIEIVVKINNSANNNDSPFPNYKKIVDTILQYVNEKRPVKNSYELIMNVFNNNNLENFKLNLSILKKIMNKYIVNPNAGYEKNGTSVLSTVIYFYCKYIQYRSEEFYNIIKELLQNNGNPNLCTTNVTNFGPLYWCAKTNIDINTGNPDKKILDLVSLMNQYNLDINSYPKLKSAILADENNEEYCLEFKKLLGLV